MNRWHNNTERRSRGYHSLSYIKPHGPITSQHLAHWIKEILGKAGVDTSVFKAHSVWGASSTAASEKGVLIEDILRTADWSTGSTFRKFYYRPSHQNSYAQTVLHVGAGQYNMDLVPFFLWTLCHSIVLWAHPHLLCCLGPMCLLIVRECYRVVVLCAHRMFAALSVMCFEIYQCYMQRISWNKIDDLTRAQGAWS